jgi:hypothetical protein
MSRKTDPTDKSITRSEGEKDEKKKGNCDEMRQPQERMR